MHKELKASEAAEVAVLEVQAMAEAMGCPDLAARELAPFDDLADTAETWGRAVRAFAAYETRKETT